MKSKTPFLKFVMFFTISCSFPKGRSLVRLPVSLRGTISSHVWFEILVVFE